MAEIASSWIKPAALGPPAISSETELRRRYRPAESPPLLCPLLFGHAELQHDTPEAGPAEVRGGGGWLAATGEW
nr:unnamed protein product [Digitaria exilis]